VRGWAVQYPFDGRTVERVAGAPIDAECTARRTTDAATAAAAAAAAEVTTAEAHEAPAAATTTEALPGVAAAAAAPLTSFSSSSPTLDGVWRLCRYTVLVGALDSNTDSNTRQRDLCQLDAMLASLAMGGKVILTALHIPSAVTLHIKQTGV
jgi:hypothetical protein